MPTTEKNKTEEAHPSSSGVARTSFNASSVLKRSSNVTDETARIRGGEGCVICDDAMDKITKEDLLEQVAGGDAEEIDSECLARVKANFANCTSDARATKSGLDLELALKKCSHDMNAELNTCLNFS